LNHRPLGYEGNSSHDPDQLQPTKPKKTHHIVTSVFALIRHASSLVSGHYSDTTRQAARLENTALKHSLNGHGQVFDLNRMRKVKKTARTSYEFQGGYTHAG
jgi:hypothetical protein